MLIVGLGNPGIKYDKTHHNVGFMAVDKICDTFNAKFKSLPKCKCELAEFSLSGETIYVMKPQTYMNLSGDAVKLFIKNKNITVDDILVIYDDMDLPLAKIRIRKNGSSGGHNGIKSIIANLGSDQFKRIRIGIGREKDASQEEVIDYVLSKFSKTEMEKLNVTLDKMPDICKDFAQKGIDYIMNTYNK